MRNLLVTLSLAAILATFGCSKKPESSPDQTANLNTPTTDQTGQAQPVPLSETSARNPAPEPPTPVVVPSGTALTVRIAEALGSKTSQTGAVFTGTVVSPVSEPNGKVAIPASSTVQGTVVAAQAKGKLKGEALLELTLTSVTVRGKSYPLQTAVWSQTAKGKGKRTAVTTGGGAALGALIGGLAGGGKGAAIGAGVGAGAGLAGGAATGNKQIDLPAESALTFTLSAPLTLKP